MKNLVIITAVASLLFSACATNKLANYSDDAYANPKEEKQLAKLAEQERIKKEAEAKQRKQNEQLAQKAKDDANPLYKDPDYNSDDYYDYKYASRVRRFNQPINGAGYYDNFYTNQYYYNQNPNCYGSSIYNSYGYMPSSQFNNYSSGLSMSFGNSYGYNPYGYNNYNSYGYNNYNPYGYNSFGGNYYGYNNGYNPYGYNNFYGNNYGTINNYYGNGNYNNNGWGYLNGHDPNSGYSTVAPRGSNGGNNGGRSSTAGMAVPEDLGYKMKSDFFQAVVQKQEETPRFTEVVKPNKSSISEGNVNAFFNNTSGQNNTNPTRNNTSQNETNLNTNPSTQQNNSTTEPKKGGFWNGFFNGTPAIETTNTTPANSNTNSNPRSGKNTKISGIENNANTINSSERNSNSGWNNSPSNSNSNGGSSSPRGGENSGGGGRPR